MTKIYKKWMLGLAALASATSAGAQDVALKTGDFNPDWESLAQWQCPEWFKDAKFGIWAHWGPQCQAESGDWYARGMYYETSWQGNLHWQRYGDPSDYGLKELCRDWKAEEWDADALVKLYKEAGAKYFFTLGQHHDNFDLWNSPYQEWNSVNIGPGRDIVKGWSDACKKYGLPLGVSMHGSHAWTWLEISQNYDGNLTKEDGAGKWWEGYDPQELYAQCHEPSVGYTIEGQIHSQWDWGNGASLPSEAYKRKFQNRVLQCINDYQPAMLYFDDTVLPFYGCDEQVGLNILAHYYNTNPSVVVMGKKLGSQHKQAMLWDVERGIPDRPQEEYWQTCTCIGSWHYDSGVYQNGSYKSAQQVVDMLVDIVSKNGNLLLSIPIRGNGSIDDKELAVVKGIAAWMNDNSVSIYGTRPWKNFGEGPLAEASNPLNSQGFNENNNYSSKDVRYAQRNDTLYATIMRWPSAGSHFTFESLGYSSEYYSGKVKSVVLLGHGQVEFDMQIDGLQITLPDAPCNEIAPVFEITFEEGEAESLTLAQFIELYEEKVAQMRQTMSYNTGKLSRTKVNGFAQLVEAAKAVVGSGDVAEAKQARDLHVAYRTLKEEGANEGGAPSGDGAQDLTANLLIEASGFTRTADTDNDLRFGAPEYWTVENFCIDNGSDGVKQGIDSYSGKPALMLGVWNDQDRDTGGDLGNARIYKKLELEAGRYYFGAAYNTTYNLDEAYIFVADQLVNTGSIPERSIAFESIGKAKSDLSFRGIYFTLPQPQEVYIGFQANLSGSSTQEFRAQEVKLLYYGNMDYWALDELIVSADELLASAKVNGNTGFYSAEAVAKLQAAYDEAYEIDENATYDELNEAYNTLDLAIKDFQTNGRNAGGAPSQTDHQDLTEELLLEADNFSRLDPSVTTRFATPMNWTVENFCIPNGADGVKNGIDKYPGYDCLYLGIWNDLGANEEGDAANARLYRTVTLKAGRYYFGATYQTTYGLSDKAYLFATDQLLPTDEIPNSSIAFYPINRASDNDGLWHGIFFTLESEQEVMLGFQVDLTNGSSAQEFRAKGIKLLYYGEITFESLTRLIASTEEMLLGAKVNDNTGFYSQAAVDELQQAIDAAKQLTAGSSYEQIEKAHNTLTAAIATFASDGKNKGGQPESIGATDLTLSLLGESAEFERTADSGTGRYGTPANWMVENYLIPSGSGNRNGIDKYPGYDCLSLGIWDDRDQAAGDMTDARIYQKVSLAAGRYYFGASYETFYNLYDAYIFAADRALPTADIATESVAYESLKNAASDGKYYGIYFTLSEPQELLLGWQANLQEGGSAQEFRAKSVILLGYDVDTAVEEITLDTAIDEAAAPRYFSITGVELRTAPQHGIFIVKQGSKYFKAFRK